MCGGRTVLDVSSVMCVYLEMLGCHCVVMCGIVCDVPLLLFLSDAGRKVLSLGKVPYFTRGP